MNHLDSAREELDRARDAATGQMQVQLDSINLGIFEEEDGELTQDAPKPKIDRIAEVAQKLDGLAQEVDETDTAGREADETDVASHLAEAREHLRAYMKDNPQGE